MISEDLQREETQILEFSTMAWSGYCSAGLIDEQQLKLIEKFDKSNKAELLEENGEDYAHLLLYIINKFQKPDSQKYVLCMIDSVLTNIPGSEKHFIATSNMDESYPAAPLLRHCSSEDQFISYKSSKILTGLLVAGAPISEKLFSEYHSFITEGCNSSNQINQQIALTCLQNLLLKGEFRLRFFNAPNGSTAFQKLVDMLKSKPNYQIQYHIVFIFWLFTFSKEISQKVENKFKMISLLMETIKNSTKEKVIRVSLMTYKNMLLKAPNVNLLPMMDNKLLALLQSLLIRKWADEDIVEEIEFLTEELKKNAHELSSFEEYAAEVRSGKLEWSPVHKSEAFWKQNVFKFHENDYELLRLLYRNLSLSSDSNVIAISIHDLGEYARCFPKGKKVLNELGAKARIMELMTSSDPIISYEALLAVQKIMVVNWEYLSKEKEKNK